MISLDSSGSHILCCCDFSRWHLIWVLEGGVILTGCLINEGKGIPGGENDLSKNTVASN